MNNWKSMLNADPTEWLLEENNPSVRYYTLTDILERLEKDIEVRETKEEIMKVGVVPKILASRKMAVIGENQRIFTSDLSIKEQYGRS